MPTFADILNQARTHLDDDKAINWQDYRLLPKLVAAYDELKATLQLNGDQLTKEVSSIMTVNAGVTDLTTVTGYPTDLVEPIWLKERQTGGTDQDFADMTEVRFIPNVQQQTTLNFWCWRTNKVLLLGALNSVQVQLRYRRNLTDPSLISASLDVIQGEIYLSYRTAALAMNSIGKDGTNLAKTAQMNLDMIIGLNSKKAQNLPTKRIGYHRRYWTSRGLWW